MKEITFEDWQKNPAPRMMWVWNNSKAERVQRKVIYITVEKIFPVVTVKTDDTFIEQYMHCEIGRAHV